MSTSLDVSTRQRAHVSHAGVNSVVLDKAAAPSTHPQAHYINNRSMEVRGAPTRPIANACTHSEPTSAPGLRSLHSCTVCTLSCS